MSTLCMRVRHTPLPLPIDSAPGLYSAPRPLALQHRISGGYHPHAPLPPLLLLLLLLLLLKKNLMMMMLLLGR